MDLFSPWFYISPDILSGLGAISYLKDIKRGIEEKAEEEEGKI